jgi:RimJ/RimL family protein N-acetyltransferase
MELLRTDRLLLRHWAESDLAAFFDLYSREDVVRWLGAHPRWPRPPATAAEAQERLSCWHEHERGLSAPFGLWAIVRVRQAYRRASGTFLGDVGGAVIAIISAALGAAR